MMRLCIFGLYRRYTNRIIIIIIKVLRQSKGYCARKLEEFPDKDWSCSALDWLLRQIDATGSADRKSGSSREGTTCARDMQVFVQMATTLSTNCNWWYCVRTAKATFHIGNFCFWVPFLNSCCSKTVVDFVEICTRKAIIKAAKRIFNSDKICHSYCDFYFGVTFLTLCTLYLCLISQAFSWSMYNTWFLMEVGD